MVNTFQYREICSPKHVFFLLLNLALPRCLNYECIIQTVWRISNQIKILRKDHNRMPQPLRTSWSGQNFREPNTKYGYYKTPKTVRHEFYTVQLKFNLFVLELKQTLWYNDHFRATVGGALTNSCILGRMKINKMETRIIFEWRIPLNQSELATLLTQ